MASWLLPSHLRAPVRLIYNFARRADDIADEGDAPPALRLQQLGAFAHELDLIEQKRRSGTLEFQQLARVIDERALPIDLFRDLLSAFSQDVTQTRYGNFAEVMDYCRRSADPIGRLLLHLYGLTAPHSLARSDSICSSLQLINFLQDIPIDYAKGRIYLPLDEMHAHGITETHIASADASHAWQSFMRFQIARAREMLLTGSPLGRTLRGRIGLELRMIVQGGERILSKLEAAGGDVFRHRPVLRKPDWIRMLARSLFVR